MREITVDNELSILLSDGHWRLKRQYADGALVISTSEGLRYSDAFAESRRLPVGVMLKGGEHILRVVLGWEARDSKWHLGLIVSPTLADVRRSRWCELACLWDASAEDKQAIMEEAGRNLANLLGVTFYAVPIEKPTTEQSMMQATPAEKVTAQEMRVQAMAQSEASFAPAPVAGAFDESATLDEDEDEVIIPPPPLPELPLMLGDWRLEQEGNTLVFVRESHWVRGHYQQMVWHFFWSLVYLTVSALTLISNLALPNTGTLIPDPQVLPYLGLLVATILALMVVYRVFYLRKQARRIVIDGANEQITGWHGERKLWSQSTRDIFSIYVSEVVSKKQRDRTSDHGEINLHLGAGQFRFLLKQGDKVDNDAIPEPKNMPDRKGSAILPLDREHVFTGLQASGLYLAESIGNLPAWYDMRLS